MLTAQSHINCRDFEAAVISEAAAQVQADVVITRNQKDFRGSRVPVQSPAEMMALLRSLE